MTLKSFLETQLQDELSKAIELELSLSLNETPFENKYRARKIYQNLIQLPKLNLIISEEEKIDPEGDTKNAILFLLNLFLGNNYFDTEEYTLSSQTLKIAESFLKAVQNQESLEKYTQYILHFYTNYAFLKVQNEDLDGALADLERAQTHYKQCLAQFESLNRLTVFHFRAELEVIPKYKNLSEEEKSKFIRPLCEGGITIEYVEKTYTQTVFFLAQIHSKLKNLNESAMYSFATIKRQVRSFQENNDMDFDYRDFTNNVLGLCAYYIGQKRYRQAMVLITEAQLIVPKKMIAEMGSFKTIIGQIYSAVFEYNLELLSKNGINQEAIDFVNHGVLTFFDTPIDNALYLILYSTYEEAKAHFKSALSSFKEAQILLPMNGFVNDYCEIVKEISRLYSKTLIIEKDSGRIDAIQDRRIEMLSNCLAEINPKHYDKQCIELTAELAEIQSNDFERYNKIFVDENKNQKKMNRVGKEALKNWNLVTDYFEKFKDDSPQSYINCLYNKARILTRLCEKEKSEIRANLTNALKCQELVRDTIKQMKNKPPGITPALQEQLEMAEEFCRMLPIRINTIK